MDLALTLDIEEGRERGIEQDSPAKDAPATKHILIFKRRQ
jgi:hypothetical protein